MKITIEIPTGMYEDIRNGVDGYNNYICTAIRQGTPLKKPKMGKWKTYPGVFSTDYSCSECNRWTSGKSRYCPNCGVKMQGV